MVLLIQVASLSQVIGHHRACVVVENREPFCINKEVGKLRRKAVKPLFQSGWQGQFSPNCLRHRESLQDIIIRHEPRHMASGYDVF